MNLKFKPLALVFSICALQPLCAQYAPPVGQPGTSAMYVDSNAFVSWATASKITRGYQDISNPALGFTSVGDSTMPTGKALSNGVASLGDGGSAICTFNKPIRNGNGFDFAVFENGFDDTFLELAFVEVSSDGVNFVRFPSHSLTDTVTQTASFGPTDATKINNLAGKYRGGYGTPFDLQELAGAANLNVNAITHVKIVDVVGSVNKVYATYDSFGRKVNDPWPTAYASGGFDLDAVGVIYENLTAGFAENSLEQSLSVYPNPASRTNKLMIETQLSIHSVELIDFSGKQVLLGNQKEMELSQLAPGVYLLTVRTEKGNLYKKIVVE